MTGPEHYREAERLLEAHTSSLRRWGTTEHFANGNAPDPQSLVDASAMAGSLLAAAQVHATLALTAATARPFIPSSFSSGAKSYNEQDHEWGRVLL